jgi:hypothetical protein
VPTRKRALAVSRAARASIAASVSSGPAPPASSAVAYARWKPAGALSFSPIAAYLEPRLKCRKPDSSPSARWRSSSSMLRRDLSFASRTTPS